MDLAGRNVAMSALTQRTRPVVLGRYMMEKDTGRVVISVMIQRQRPVVKEKHCLERLSVCIEEC